MKSLALCTAACGSTIPLELLPVGGMFRLNVVLKHSFYEASSLTLGLDFEARDTFVKRDKCNIYALNCADDAAPTAGGLSVESVCHAGMTILPELEPLISTFNVGRPIDEHLLLKYALVDGGLAAGPKSEMAKRNAIVLDYNAMRIGLDGQVSPSASFVTDTSKDQWIMPNMKVRWGNVEETVSVQLIPGEKRVTIHDGYYGDLFSLLENGLGDFFVSKSSSVLLCVAMDPVTKWYVRDPRLEELRVVVTIQGRAVVTIGWDLLQYMPGEIERSHIQYNDECLMTKLELIDPEGQVQLGEPFMLAAGGLVRFDAGTVQFPRLTTQYDVSRFVPFVFPLDTMLRLRKVEELSGKRTLHWDTNEYELDEIEGGLESFMNKSSLILLQGAASLIGDSFTFFIVDIDCAMDLLAREDAEWEMPGIWRSPEVSFIDGFAELSTLSLSWKLELEPAGSSWRSSDFTVSLTKLNNFIYLKLTQRVPPPVSFSSLRLSPSALRPHSRTSSATSLLSNEDPSMCSICLSQLEDGEAEVELPCLHMFHTSCFEQWADANNASCPNCRKQIPRQDIPD